MESPNGLAREGSSVITKEREREIDRERKEEEKKSGQPPSGFGTFKPKFFPQEAENS